MNKIERSCLSCRRYRPEDQFTGRCRLDKGKIDHRKYPIMKHEDCCGHWQDAGQQYYIRVGWLKGLQNSRGPLAPDHLL